MDEKPIKKTSKTNGAKDPLDDILEIELVDDYSELKGHLRKNFRYSVHNRDDCWVVIENKQYPLWDLSHSGLGISVKMEVAFQIGDSLGDILTECTLNVMDCNISGLNYKIVHMSPGTGDLMTCGLNWLNPEPENREKLASALRELKALIFK